MSRFKIGDMVRCVDNTETSLVRGGVYYVRGVLNERTIWLMHHSDTYPSDRFELCVNQDELKAEAELARLLRTANEGQEAQKTLYEMYRDKIKYSYMEYSGALCTLGLGTPYSGVYRFEEEYFNE